MTRIIGIDLGTTTSCVAVLDDKNQPKTLVAADGERTTPSWVAWATTGEVSVGTRARRQAVTNPSATVHGAKRLIGRKVNAEDVAAFARLSRQVPDRRGAQRRRVGPRARPADQPAGDRGARAAPHASGRRGSDGRAGHARGGHGAGVLRRRAAPGDTRRRPDRRARRDPHPQRANRRGARVRRAPHDGRPPAHRRVRPRGRNLRHLDHVRRERHLRGACDRRR